MNTSQFITLIVLLVGQFYWMDRKLTGLTKEMHELALNMAKVKQILADHLSDGHGGKAEVTTL